MRVERDHEELVAEHAEPAIDETAAGGQVRRQLAAVAPDLAPGARVERPRHVLRSGDVQHVVAQERRRFEVAERARLERPLRDEAVDVGGRDLRQRAVPLVGVVAAEGQPARAVGRQALGISCSVTSGGGAACCAARAAVPAHEQQRSPTRRTVVARISLLWEQPPDRIRGGSAGSERDRRGRLSLRRSGPKIGIADLVSFCTAFILSFS